MFISPEFVHTFYLRISRSVQGNFFAIELIDSQFYTGSLPCCDVIKIDLNQTKMADGYCRLPSILRKKACYGNFNNAYNWKNHRTVH